MVSEAICQAVIAVICERPKVWTQLYLIWQYYRLDKD